MSPSHVNSNRWAPPLGARERAISTRSSTKPSRTPIAGKLFGDVGGVEGMREPPSRKWGCLWGRGGVPPEHYNRTLVTKPRKTSWHLFWTNLHFMDFLESYVYVSFFVDLKYRRNINEGLLGWRLLKRRMGIHISVSPKNMKTILFDDWTMESSIHYCKIAKNLSTKLLALIKQ